MRSKNGRIFILAIRNSVRFVFNAMIEYRKFSLRVFNSKELMNKAINDNYKVDRTLFNDLITTMEIGSLCALGGGLPLPIRNSLQYFDGELKEYFKN